MRGGGGFTSVGCWADGTTPFDLASTLVARDARNEPPVQQACRKSKPSYWTPAEYPAKGGRQSYRNRLDNASCAYGTRNGAIMTPAFCWRPLVALTHAKDSSRVISRRS